LLQWRNLGHVIGIDSISYTFDGADPVFFQLAHRQENARRFSQYCQSVVKAA
jgi:hypothetical protein